ncbi:MULTISPECIES: acyl-CoA thioesterase [unclassified Chryseobacterium]|uniref:acyl-CoA thioesterase n=1 Tax=unclassified Chryseobacterium TaxID=2593645 RepID=UPI000D3D4233|nr:MULTISPECIES: hotdog domain-containing protein [unclassified Chryseobacterium]PTT75245.1 hypothetical protein DBR25_08805 [Chryseobacterium sp. HMWF001]PVV50769.1 hypothetical protein DD829_21435 [Chryseobacterium sp. HMWF035]
MKTYTLQVQLRYSDFDAQKIVNHSKICTYIEMAYVEFLSKKINTDWNYDGMPLVLRKETTEFLLPIHSGSKPECTVSVLNIGGASFTLAVKVMDTVTGKLYVTAQRVLVGVNFEFKRPEALSHKVKEALKQFQQE